MDRATFTEAVYRYCQETGASVTSWYRTDAHNAAVGGVRYSPHLAGLAVDVVYDGGGDPAHRAATAELLGLHRIIERDHDHLQPVAWAR